MESDDDVPLTILRIRQSRKSMMRANVSSPCAFVAPLTKTRSRPNEAITMNASKIYNHRQSQEDIKTTIIM